MITATSEHLEIQVNKIHQSKLENIDLTTLTFGEVFSDHMFVADYSDGAWQSTEIVPFGDIQVSPNISSIHYGQSVFEGMKAFRDHQGQVMIFRPEAHFRRLNRSAERLCMPTIPESVFMEGLKQLIHLDQNWVPAHEGAALYIRPVFFATDDYLGMRPSKSYKLIILSCPVNVYYSSSLKVYTTTEYVRASPGGVGYVKAAGNYARSLMVNEQAKKAGYNVVLWLDAPQRKYIEEFSTMNAFFQIDDFVVTPKLRDTFLDGITRDSVITLLREGGTNVYERDISIEEVFDMADSGQLKEAFGTGTAAVMAPVESITWEDRQLHLSPHHEWQYYPKIKSRLEAIRAGLEADTHHWLMQVQA